MTTLTPVAPFILSITCIDGSTETLTFTTEGDAIYSLSEYTNINPRLSFDPEYGPDMWEVIEMHFEAAGTEEAFTIIDGDGVILSEG